MNIRTVLSAHPVIPVINFNDAQEIASMAEHLLSKGVNCIEITLRNPQALDHVRVFKSEFGKEFTLGVGTVTQIQQLEAVAEMGVDFVVSPGLSPHLVPLIKDLNMPYLPGVVTPTEVIQGMDLGFDTFKLFPASSVGGLNLLKTYASVFPQLKFCPTGGLTEENHMDYLALDNVISVGGSWLAK